jgi:hypothetical protein
MTAERFDLRRRGRSEARPSDGKASANPHKWFSFCVVPAETGPVRVLLIAVLLFRGVIALRAQEAVLPPMVVTGTFELRHGPSITESFARHLDNEIEARQAAEDAIARSPFFSARFWSYIPLRLESCSSDSSQFFTPSYLTSDYRKSADVLEQSRKQSLFDAR